MSPLIFLDIDGVLNNNRWMDKNGLGTLDPFNVQMLVQLVNLTNADLVISSDWRRYYSYDVLCCRLINEGVPARFVGTTPCVEPENAAAEEIIPRGWEIDSWLKMNQSKESFCILDDGCDMHPYQDRLIQTNDDCGLVQVDVEKAVFLLMKDLRGDKRASLS